MRITARDIETLYRLRMERAALEKREEALRERLISALHEVGGQARRGPWRCVLVPFRGQPCWKNEYVKVAGAERAAALVALAPMHERIVIEEHSDEPA